MAVPKGGGGSFTGKCGKFRRVIVAVDLDTNDICRRSCSTHAFSRWTNTIWSTAYNVETTYRSRIKWKVTVVQRDRHEVWRLNGNLTAWQKLASLSMTGLAKKIDTHKKSSVSRSKFTQIMKLQLLSALSACRLYKTPSRVATCRSQAIIQLPSSL